MQPEEKKKILMLFCGGTIAMAADPRTGALKPALSPQELYRLAPKIRKAADLDVKFITDIDSSDMTVREWKKIISAIRKNMNEYDAFVLTHGTDTMVETANAIAYAFGNALTKPVIMTGSQAPPNVLGSDAVPNIERAVRTAAGTTRPEVLVSFHDHVHRGTRCRKSSEYRLAAFETPFGLPVAEHTAEIHWHMNPHPETRAISDPVLPYFNPRVISVSLHASQDAKHMNDALLSATPQERITGLVWVSLGAGNVPKIHHSTIINARKLNVPIVVTSQFPGGKVNMETYDAGLKALKLGAIPAGDMTPEAANVKLRWALGVAENLISKGRMTRKQLIPFVRHVFAHDRAGEVTLEKSGPLKLPERARKR